MVQVAPHAGLFYYACQTRLYRQREACFISSLLLNWRTHYELMSPSADPRTVDDLKLLQSIITRDLHFSRHF
jgi:hypothetical protein